MRRRIADLHPFRRGNEPEGEQDADDEGDDDFLVGFPDALEGAEGKAESLLQVAFVMTGHAREDKTDDPKGGNKADEVSKRGRSLHGSVCVGEG